LVTPRHLRGITGNDALCTSGRTPALAETGGGGVVFRRDKQVDSFQRQMSALRQRLGEGETAQDGVSGDFADYDENTYVNAGNEPYGNDQGMNAADTGGYSFGDYAPQDGGGDLAEEDGLQVPEMPVVDGQISVVATDTVWKGELQSDGSLHVYGRVEGSLTAKEDIWIAEGATVDATLTARRVVVAGSVSGTVVASERFEALPQGQIHADVNASTFVVHEGAKINGQLKMAQAEGTTGSAYERSTSLTSTQRRTRTGV